ncbi:MAG: CsbD family protein [Chloroflexi bacterium]|nr:MAG: CsbD family protein [Chloroflexota bacterium]
MNEDMLKGRWKQVRGQIQEKWGELTDDDLDQIQGRRDQLIGKLQARYGYARAEAESRVDEFFEDWEDVSYT